MNSADRLQKMEKGFDMGQAVAEADRCLLCHDAPCSSGCPANTDPGAFIRKLRLKNITGAIRTIKENNILGGVCGILCPTDRLCEKECCAAGLDRPIRIGQIQRLLIEHGWERKFRVFEKKELDKEKIAVVGAGPAGLSCAAELAREGFAVTVFEARPEPGGMLRYGVPSYRLEARFLERELEDIRALGVEFKCNTRIQGEKSAENLLGQGFAAVFLAPGLWGAARLQAEPESIDGLYSSVEFLSAMRDGGLEELEKKVKGRTAAVIGGGAVAMDCAESAARMGAGDVYLVYRRSWSQMPAERDERFSSLDAGVHYLLLNQPAGYATDESGHISGVNLVRTRLGEPDSSGRRRPDEIPGSDWVLDADLVVEAIGNQADEDAAKCWPNVEVDGKKLIKVEADVGRTSVEGVFAGGDIVRGPDLVVTAVQDGKNAAKAIRKYVSDKEVLS